MDTTIFFYSGTGNSLWTARKIAELSGTTELIPIVLRNEESVSTVSRRVGLVFPVHMWGLPRRVLDFIARLQVDSAAYYFAIAVNAGQVAATLLQLKELLKKKGADLNAGFSLCMPSNYIPWGGAIAVAKQQELFNASLDKIKVISEVINKKEIKAPEQGPALQNFFLSALYKLGSPRIPQMDKSFWVDGKCTGCGICEKICPAHNIVMKKGNPVWQHRCEQCLACIQWCPAEAIQYGKKTAAKKRYHHPEVKISDILNCVK